MTAEKRSRSDLAARALRRVERPAPVRDDGADEMLVDLVHRTAREQRRRTMIRRIAFGSAALVAAAACVVLITRPTPAVVPLPAPSEPPTATLDASGAVEVTSSRDGASRPAGAVRAGDRVASLASGEAVVTSPRGSRVVLAPESEMSIAEDGAAQVFQLTRGSLDAHVVKLATGERFVVRTSDVEVEVRGTAFRVERLSTPEACHPEVRTRVVVQEGVVAVRSRGSEQLLRPGDRWPAECPANAVPAPSPSATPSTTTNLPPSSSSAAPSRDQLAEANALFARATAARKTGDARGAVSLYDQMLREHPSSPLVEHAMAERMRALATYDSARAEQAAREYNSRYPAGFARAEAEAIIALP